MSNYYTGVGSRDTPKEILEIMTKISSVLEKHNFILRTGDAKGADSAFIKGTTNSSNVEEYNANHSKTEHFHITEKIHPAWDRCSEFAKKLHTRNLYQVMGLSLELPSSFLICWTRNGKDIGGTRTAIIYSRDNNIPVFNLAIKEDISSLISLLIEKYDIPIM
jgi:hypothetical protein